MRFKIDDNLLKIAAQLPQIPVDVVAVNLCRAFVNTGMLEDTPDNYGVKIIKATGPQYVSDIVSVLCGFMGTETVSSDIFDAFCALIVMGEGDCPVCGGSLIYDEMQGHELNDGDYYTPNSWAVDLYVYHCANCGEIYKTKNEL